MGRDYSTMTVSELEDLKSLVLGRITNVPAFRRGSLQGGEVSNATGSNMLLDLASALLPALRPEPLLFGGAGSAARSSRTPPARSVSSGCAPGRSRYNRRRMSVGRATSCGPARRGSGAP